MKGVMMQENNYYLEKGFIIWNAEFGVRDFVTLGEIDSQNRQAWLEEPYEMVGPFCLETLCKDGKISFEACMVMTQEYWQKERFKLHEESVIKQQQAQAHFYKEIKNHNQRRQSLQQSNEKEHRILLQLPLEVQLEASQIKEAYKKQAKVSHPDVGGTHDAFIQLTIARDELLDNISLQSTY